jgi:hypothetical protein
VASLLRLYHLETTQFDGDQAKIFRMAYDAVHHGMLVATANGASLPLLNPPATIYFLMLPASFSADPFWGAALTAILAILAVGLTYVIGRRYFGRLAGALAALLYAIACYPIFYSRFIWNQNFLLLLVPFFIFLLLLAVIERRKGWLALALPLLGLLYQFHGSSSFLAVPLILAVLLAPGTWRWRDGVIGLLGLLVIYAPYLLWEIHTSFADIVVLLTASQGKSTFDGLSFLLYFQFLSPYNELSAKIPGTPDAAGWFLITSGYITAALAILAALALLLTVFTSQSAIGPVEDGKWRRRWNRLVSRWRELRADQGRAGLVIVLAWQLAPLLLLLRHSIDLHPHYLIILLPGPFLLLGMLLADLYEGLRPQTKLIAGILTLLLITAQLGSSLLVVLSLAHGNYQDRAWSNPYYNDLHSLQNAVQRADELAQQKHISRLYISADKAIRNSMQFFSEQTRTPAIVVNNSCLVLPGTGSALLLIGPYDSQTEELTQHFASATLLESLPHLGGPPFKLYLVEPKSQSNLTNGPVFSQELQFEGAERFSSGNQVLIVARWTMLQESAASYQSYDSYSFISNGYNGQTCVLTAQRAGDQLLALLPPQADNQLAIRTFAYRTTVLTAQLLPPLPLKFETGKEQAEPLRWLKTEDGRDTMMITLS